MAGAADTLVFKLMIDGKEAIATLDLTKGEFLETGAAATAAQEKIQAAYKNLSAEALKYDAVTEANVKSLTEFMKTQSISIDMIENTITVLQNEIKTLDVNSDAWKQKIIASTNLKAAMGQLVTSHTALGNAQQQMMPGLTNMNQAIGQFGYILGDANMFMMSAQMGIMSIANNIPFVVQGFMQARQAAGEQASMMQLLTKSIMGGGGVIIGVNALMLLLQVLPAFFKDNSKAVEEHSKEIENLTNKYEKLTQAQLENKKAEIEKELLQKTLEYGSKYGDNQKLVEAFPLIGGMIEAITPGFKTKMTADESESYNKLLAENQALTQVMVKHGVIKEYEAQRNLLLEKRKEIKDPDQIHYLDQVINYYDELIKKSDYKDQKDKDKRASGINSLANEKAKYEELEGKIIEIGIRKDKELSDYRKELMIIEQLKNAKLESLAAEEKIIETKKKKTPADEQKLANIQLEKQITEGDADVQTEKLKKDHNEKIRELDFKLAEQKLELEEKTNAEIIQNRIDHYKKLLELEPDPEKRKDIELKIGNAEIEMLKNSKEGKKFFDEFKAKSESDPYKQQKEELGVEEIASIKRAEMFGASEEQKTNIHNYYTKQREVIERQSMFNTLTQTSQMLGQLAGLFGKHTAAYKLLATAQVMIETYKGVMALYAPPPVGVGPVLAPFMTAAVIGTGIANVANIMKQDTTMKGFARGGVIVGENGMEVIAPAEEYATGMAELVTRTAYEVRNYFNAGSGNDNSALLGRIDKLSDRIEDLASRPALAYLNNDEAIKIGQHYEYEQKTSR